MAGKSTSDRPELLKLVVAASRKVSAEAAVPAMVRAIDMARIIL
jgi:hypothetical protein